MTPRLLHGRSWALAAIALALWATQAEGRPCRLSEAEALLNARKSSEARQLLEECVTGDSRDAKAALVLGQTYLLDRDENRAVFWFEKASELDPTSSACQLWLGRAYGAQALHASVVRQPGLARKVHRAFERAVLLDPDNLEARSSLLQYYLRAPSLLGGSKEKARAEAEEIRHRDPLRGYRAFGRIAEHEKRFDVAQEGYERAMAEFPQESDPVFWSVELAERRKDYPRAFDLLESLIGRKPEESEALYRIGALAAVSGQRLDRGEEILRLYLEHRPTGDEPSLAMAHDRLGAIYVRRKDHALARREYLAALELDPMLGEARQALAKLRSLSAR